MADQRPAFRFRLPWLPAGQPPRPSLPRPPAQPAATTAPPARTPQTSAPQPASNQPVTTPPSSNTTQADETRKPPAQPNSSTTTSAATSQTAENEAPPSSTISTTPSPPPTQATETQDSVQPPASITASQTAERPPFRPPGLAPSPAPAPSPQSQAPRSQSQPPSSPSRATVQPRVPSPSASPSRAAAQSRPPSQPSTPPRTSPQPRAASQPSTPARRSPQLPSAPRTSTQSRSPSLPAVRVSEQKSSPPSPSRSNAQVKTTSEAGNEPTSPLKGEQSLPKESSQPSGSPSTEVVSTPDIQLPKSAADSSSQDLHLKEETKSEAVNGPRDRAPVEIQLNEMKKEPSEDSRNGVAKTPSTIEDAEKASTTQTPNHSTIYPEPESPLKALKPRETKEVREVVQGTIEDAQEEKAIPFHSEPTRKTVSSKDITETSSTSNSRHAKITAAHPKNSSMPVDNRHKHPMSNGEHVPLHKEIREDISKLVNKMAPGDSKQSIDDRPVSIVTLAGENRGATMHVGSDSTRKEGAIHIHRGYKIKPDESPEATTDGEEGFKAKKSDHLKTKEDQAPEAYVNSNVQAINNSIMFNSSITEGNPGVHLVRSTIPTESKTPSAKPEHLETRKAEFNMTPSRRLTHEPVVRRRCLRGLFLESSDSDMDSTKPRSHGCRVACNEKRKENNIDVL